MRRTMSRHEKGPLFEAQATQILSYLKQHVRYDNGFLPRPFFIEITGSPSAGKTTTIAELDKWFRRMGFRVLRPQEGAEVVRHIGRDTPLYNIRTGLYALQMLIDLSAGHLYDLVIFDRGIFDVYGWMLYWLEKGKLSADETALIQKFFLSRFWLPKIDAAYFMVCEPKVAVERELRIALSDKLGETTNPETVMRLVNRYKEAFQTLSPDNPQLYIIDTTLMSEQEMVEYVCQKKLDVLESKAKTPS